MRTMIFAAVLALTAAPALAHDFDMEEAQADIARLIASDYQGETAIPMPLTAVVERLEALGYTDIEDFDVDADEYEIEATAPGGEEVEIEMHPISGEILEIEED